jgi:hypothetical protein
MKEAKTIHALARTASVIGSHGNKDIIKTLAINCMEKIKKIQISGQMLYVRENKRPEKSS